ncbi:glypican-6-like [Babylonia areolata]|uniref:glypican-6-like n=1 Tax=Babylonia areolata TaxID=304850 RepID=UPI003FD49C0A
MAVGRCVSVWNSWGWLLFVLCVFASKYIVCATSASNGKEQAPSFTCDQVRELFEGDFGAPAALHLQPQHESEQSMCRGGAEGGGPHSTCCSLHTEDKFAQLGEKRLKEQVRTRNHALKKHLTNFLARYQDLIAQLVMEAQNRTSVFLTRLHKIPWAQHEAEVREFFSGLLTIVRGGPAAESLLEETLRQFFSRLFPSVFNYVLTVQGQQTRQPISDDYRACLTRYAEQIQPFGNQPDVILKQLRHTVRHAIVFQAALKTFTDSLTLVEGVSMDTSCRHALLRLQVCPGCRGVSSKDHQVKPCGGLCLNVMRGCLARMSELSSSWDDLVVAFENVQVGMMGRHDLQKTLLYMDMNVSEAIMMAMTDNSTRIYDEVRVKCGHLSHHINNNNNDDDNTAGEKEGGGGGGVGEERHTDTTTSTIIPAGSSEAIPARHVHRVQGFQQEVRGVLRYLEDSRGLFHRLPDSLCLDPARFAQDMQASLCWNGTSVSRYMGQVPEANFLSQVQHNQEVKVTLRVMDADREYLLVKETLTHMRRNLSNLLNSELMLGDDPIHRKVGGGGGGGGAGAGAGGREGSGGDLYQPVIVDDEDLVAGYGSGSGSGSGDDSSEDTGREHTSKPDDTHIDPPRPTRPTTPSSSHRATFSPALLLLLLLLLPCVLAQRLDLPFQ